MVIGILLTSMTVYDLLPYRERNYVTHHGSTSRSYDLAFNTTTPNIMMLVDPVIDLQDPFPDSNSTYLRSYNINVSVLVESSLDSIYVFSGITSGGNSIVTNTTHVFNGVQLNGNRQWCMFFKPENTTDLTCVFSYTANYTVDMIYTRSPKTYAWASVLSFFSVEGIILAGVVIFASVLIYVSTKMVTDS